MISDIIAVLVEFFAVVSVFLKVFIKSPVAVIILIENIDLFGLVEAFYPVHHHERIHRLFVLLIAYEHQWDMVGNIELRLILYPVVALFVLILNEL